MPTHITAEDAQRLLRYDNGKLYWKVDVARNVKVGDEAGKADTTYKRVMFNGRMYQIHRLVFAIHHGYFPRVVDHKNGDKLDNQIDNLRAATHKQNSVNQRLHTDNKSGAKNVCYRKETGRWRVCIKHIAGTVDRSFTLFDDACRYAETMRSVVHGQFARST